MLEGATTEGVLAHKLGPLAARRLRLLGREVPPSLEAEERLARIAWMTAGPLLRRIRELHDAPLLLLKGPEVAALYPDRARGFVDIDILAVGARELYENLRGAGFAELEEAELYESHHHFSPLNLRGVWLNVEVHVRPMWPEGLSTPSVATIVDESCPSAVSVHGISAPQREHQALLLAVHAWMHEPLHTLRDLLDIAAVTAVADRSKLAALSRQWGIGRIWQTTQRTIDAIFDERPHNMPLRLWARHLPRVRERTVLDNHLQRWLHYFWEGPPNVAIPSLAEALRMEILPDPGELWRDKATRVGHALRRPTASMSAHKRGWREARELDP